MGKFENVLLISDVDGTLVDRSWVISKENIEAAEYFKNNGGKFTYATGRQVPVTRGIIDQLTPNAPAICYNGAAIYDYSKNCFLWSAPLDNEIIDIVMDIAANCPFVNIEINVEDSIYVFKGESDLSPRYEQLVSFFKTVDSLGEVPFPWFKVVMVMPEEYMQQARSYVEAQPYYSKYQYCQSASFLYEVLNFGVNKGSALPHLVKEMGNIEKIVAVGDNENDIELIKQADIGFAVADSSPLLLNHCNRLTVSQSEHAIADIVNKLDKNLI